MADYKLINGKVSNSSAQPSSMRNGTSAKNRSNSASKTKSKGQGGSQKSPSQVIPIHVDGDRDELSDVDRDLTLAELELKLLHESHDMLPEQESTSRAGGGGRISVASRMSEVEGSRARPIKPHENEPFLTVGSINTGINEAKRSSSTLGVRFTPKEGSRGASRKTDSRGSSRTISSNGPLSSTSRSNFSSPTPSLGNQSSRSQAYRSYSKMYVSPNALSPRPNPRIKMPFKHNIRKPSEKSGQEPSQELKELTAQATYHINRVLACENGGTTKKRDGHLRKGKLKPLYPVSVSGPSITQCRGILSETREYSPSASRTLQRRRHIVSQLKSGEVGLHNKSSHAQDGCESVHRVSAASSVEDLVQEGGSKELPNNEHFQAELASMEQDAIFSQELEEKMSFSKEMSTVSKDDCTPGPARTPLSLDQGIESLQNPDFSTPHPSPDSKGDRQVQREETMEMNGGGEQQGNADNKAISWRNANTPVGAEPGENMVDVVLQSSPSVNNANNNFRVDGMPAQSPQEVQRPQSASVHYSHPDPAKTQRRPRPKTVASGKAVHFADHSLTSDGTRVPLANSSWVSKGKEPSKETQEKTKEKKSSGEGCKPAEWDKNRTEKDDDGDDKDDGGGGSGGGGVSREASVQPVSSTSAQEGESKSKSSSDSQNSSSGQAKGEEKTDRDSGSTASDTFLEQCVDSVKDKEAVQDKEVSVVSTVQPPVTERTLSEPRRAVSEHGMAQDFGTAGIPVGSSIRSRDDSPKEVNSRDTGMTSQWIASSQCSMQSVSAANSLSRTSELSPCLSAHSLPELTWSSIVGEEDGQVSVSSSYVSPPPVTWCAKGDIGKGAPAAPVPDQAGLLKLLLEVSAEVDRETQRSPNQQSSSASQNQALELAGDMILEDPSMRTGSSEVRSKQPDVSSKVCETSISSELPSCNACQGTATGSSDDHQTREEADPGMSDASFSSWATAGSVDRNRDTSKVFTRRQFDKNRHSRSSRKAPASSVTTLVQDTETSNPRVGLFVCKHEGSIRKVDMGKHKSSVKKIDVNLPMSHSMQADKHGSQGDEVGNGEELRKELSVEHDHVWERPVNPGHQSRDGHGNSLTELFTHFSLGVRDRAAARPSESNAVKVKDFSSGDSSCVTGILKKNRVPVPALSTSQNKASQLKNMPTQKIAMNLSADCDETSLSNTKTASKRQTFTHHSKQPFIYPSNDPICNAVATRLKFGDSPYLKELKLPPQRGFTSRMKEKGKVTRSEKRAAAGEETCPMGTKTCPKSHHNHRPSKVKFADFSMQSLDLNQNCIEDEEYWDSTFLTQMDNDSGIDYGPTAQDCSSDEAADEGQIYDAESYNNCDAFQTVEGDSGDVAAQFQALEAELNAVRSEIKLKILDNQADQILDQIEKTSTITETSDGVDEDSDAAAAADNDDDDDDGFVYEDEGTSDEDEANKKKERNRNENSSTNREQEDEDDAYCTYYHALLLDYRRKCMKAGNGNLVISDKLTWPTVTSEKTASTTADTGMSSSSGIRKKVRPYSAGAFRTLSERRTSVRKRRNSLSDSSSVRYPPRPGSRSDSGWESDGMSDSGGRALDRWSSSLSVGGESVFSGCSNKSAWSDGSQPPCEASRVTEAEKADAEAVAKRMGSRPSSGREEHPDFEIVASAVPKTAARTKTAESTAKGPAAPFPPLCFAVNARPPPGSLFFFAYSTYMNPDRLGSLLQKRVDKRYWAILFGFDLAFNKKASEETSGGLANIVFNPFASVEGCIFLLTPAELQKLDAFTGAPQHYARVVLPVWMSEVSGSADDLGLAKHCVPAVTYIAQNDWTLENNCPPNEYVASQCLKSADMLSPNYWHRLRSLVSPATNQLLPLSLVS